MADFALAVNIRESSPELTLICLPNKLGEISAGKKIDIAETAPGLSPSLVKVVLKAMETRVSHRYFNVESFNAAVRDAWLSYQKRGLKPMLPRVKRAAWAYFAPRSPLSSEFLQDTWFIIPS